jgi:hypothetical protein
MSDEMVMRTTDSPAVATGDYGAAEALLDSIQGAADPQEWALNDEESNNWQLGSDEDVYTDDGFEPENLEQTLRQQLYDTLADEPGSVPYERFREVNEQARSGREYQERLERWSDVIQQLESNGFQSAADVQRALQEQQWKQQEDQIRSEYDQLTSQDIVSPELAQAQAEAEINKLRYDRLMNQMSEYMVTQQRESALQQYPYARRGMDMYEGLIQNGMNPMDAAEYVHNSVAGIVESIVPQLTGMLSERMQVPTPIDTSYSNQQVVSQPDPVQSRGALSSISRLLGIGRTPNQL